MLLVERESGSECYSCAWLSQKESKIPLGYKDRECMKKEGRMKRQTKMIVYKSAKRTCCDEPTLSAMCNHYIPNLPPSPSTPPIDHHYPVGLRKKSRRLIVMKTCTHPGLNQPIIHQYVPACMLCFEHLGSEKWSLVTTCRRLNKHVVPRALCFPST
jgi:hypothetical protein